jgi:ankyrin repeat protein
MLRAESTATPLCAASYGGHENIVQVLPHRGSNPALADKNGLIPLNSALDNGHIEVVKPLFDKAADLTVENKDEWISLSLALSKGLDLLYQLLAKCTRS